MRISDWSSDVCSSDLEAICEGMDRHSLQAAMKPGAARNAVDCALWDLEARLAGSSVAAALELENPHPIVTAFTLSLAEPDALAAAATENSHRPLLKIKLGTPAHDHRLQALRRAAPASTTLAHATE